MASGKCVLDNAYFSELTIVLTEVCWGQNTTAARDIHTLNVLRLICEKVEFRRSPGNDTVSEIAAAACIPKIIHFNVMPHQYLAIGDKDVRNKHGLRDHSQLMFERTFFRVGGGVLRFSKNGRTFPFL